MAQGNDYVYSQEPIDFAHWFLLVGAVFLIPQVTSFPKKMFSYVGVPLVLVGIACIIGMCVLDFIWWSFYIPNGIASLFKIVEVPHSVGGVAMGTSENEGVVDTFGRVYGYDNFMVLDGSILPKSLGPNPALTILVFSERGTQESIRQLENEGKI